MKIKKEFPIFKKNKKLVYLDNAATTQKPKSVIEAIVEFYNEYNSNVHRGLYPLSEKATDRYEKARETIAKFINAESEEIIFTSGTTDSINALATSLVKSEMIGENPKILLTELEHHANIIPWQQIDGSKIDYIPLNGNYELNLPDLAGVKSGIKNYDSAQFDVISLTAASNVTGTVVNIEEVIKKFRGTNPKVLCVADAAQAVAHMSLDVKKLDVDFLAFSGHKMYGPTGIGVLYIKKDYLEKMEPFRTGGGMICEVKRDNATWAKPPAKFEAGTPNIAGAIGLAEAVEFIQKVGFDYIQEHEGLLRLYLIERLLEIKNIEIFHPVAAKSTCPVMSFYIEGTHPHDISEFLGEEAVCVRAGHHCTQILHREVLKVPATVRVSLAMYNTKDDIDKFVKKVNECVEVYGKRP